MAADRPARWEWPSSQPLLRSESCPKGPSRKFIAAVDSILSQAVETPLPGQKFFHRFTLTLAPAASGGFPARRCVAEGRGSAKSTPHKDELAIYPLARDSGSGTIGCGPALGGTSRPRFGRKRAKRANGAGFGWRRGFIGCRNGQCWGQNGDKFFSICSPALVGSQPCCRFERMWNIAGSGNGPGNRAGQATGY